MARTIKKSVTTTNDVYAQETIVFSGRRLVKIIRGNIHIIPATTIADGHIYEMAICNASQGSMPAPNNHSVKYYKKLEVRGAPGGPQDLSFEFENLPSFTADNLYLCVLSTGTGAGAEVVYFTLFLSDDKRVS